LYLLWFWSMAERELLVDFEQACSRRAKRSRHLDAFERYLAKSDGDYFVGGSLTAADLQSFNVLRNWYKAFAPDVFRSEYPKLDEFVQRVESLPRIRTYIDNDQEPTTWFQLPEVALRLTSAAELDAIKVCVK